MEFVFRTILNLPSCETGIVMSIAQRLMDEALLSSCIT